MKSVGVIGTIISVILLLFGINKYNNAISFYEASGCLATVWRERADNYKIMIIVCSVVLLISIILLISSFFKDKNINNTMVISSSNSTQEKLQELEHIYKNNLITEEEYENKRKEILNKL